MPEINLTAGTLPPPACYASEQDRLNAYAAAMVAQFNAPAEWAANAVAPGDLSLYWLRLDANNNPIEVLKYNSNVPAGWGRLTTQFTYGVGGGAPNAYTMTLTPASSGVNQAYRTGVAYAFGATAANTGASTLSVDGLTAKAITKFGTTALAAADIVNGQMCVVVYDGTRFQLLNPGLNIGPSAFAPGTDRQFLRTNSTPATVWESGYITPVANYQAIPAIGGGVSFNHGFSVMPIFWDIGIICTTSDVAVNGYDVNDYIPFGSLGYGTGEHGIMMTVYANLSVIGMRRSTDHPIEIFDKTNSNQVGITEANWKVMARAIR